MNFYLITLTFFFFTLSFFLCLFVCFSDYLADLSLHTTRSGRCFLFSRWRFAFVSPMLALILLISQPSGFTASSV